jgi:hypothetical protein
MPLPCSSNSYLVVVSDVRRKDTKIPARALLKYLLDNRCWFFHRTPRSLLKGDWLIFYVAGKGNHYFAAEATVASEAKEPRPNDEAFLKEVGLSWLHRRIDLEQVQFWPHEVPAERVLPLLEFVTDKRNWGVYFRQGLKRLSAVDRATLEAARDSDVLG